MTFIPIIFILLKVAFKAPKKSYLVDIGSK